MIDSNLITNAANNEQNAALMYPATHVLLEAPSCKQTAQTHAVSLNAAAWHARQIVEHAMSAGDRATAALMTEAFARIALHSTCAARPGITPSAHLREYTALQDQAMSLLALAYPDAASNCDTAELDLLIAQIAEATQ